MVSLRKLAWVIGVVIFFSTLLQIFAIFHPSRIAGIVGLLLSIVAVALFCYQGYISDTWAKGHERKGDT